MQMVRAAFFAHARLAPVSRSVYGLAVGDTENSADASALDENAEIRRWILHRDNPEWWWWHCYFTTEGSVGELMSLDVYLFLACMNQHQVI